MTVVAVVVVVDDPIPVAVAPIVESVFKALLEEKEEAGEEEEVTSVDDDPI